MKGVPPARRVLAAPILSPATARDRPSMWSTFRQQALQPSVTCALRSSGSRSTLIPLATSTSLARRKRHGMHRRSHRRCIALEHASVTHKPRSSHDCENSSHHSNNGLGCTIPNQKQTSSLQLAPRSRPSLQCSYHVAQQHLLSNIKPSVNAIHFCGAGSGMRSA